VHSTPFKYLKGVECTAPSSEQAFQISVNNRYVSGNRASSEGINSKARYVSEGGGIWADSRVTMINNTVYGNSTRVIYGTESRGGGIHGGKTIVNTIVRNNSARTAPEIHGNAGVSYCNVKGGFQGIGNIDRDPEFEDPGAEDFHLRYTSPCWNRGTLTVSGLPQTDFEGDPRITDGKPDIGADEFHIHVHVTGTLETPQGQADIKVIGVPGNPVLYALSLTPTVLHPPVSIPGVGLFYLEPPFFPFDLGTIPSSGVITLSIPLTTKLPHPIRVPMQAVVGTTLTTVYIADVK